MQAEGPFVVSYNKSPAVSSPGSWAQWLSDAVRFCCPQRPDSDAFPVPAKLCWLQAPHPPHTAKSKAWAIPSPPPMHLLLKGSKTFTGTYQQTRLPNLLARTGWLANPP